MTWPKESVFVAVPIYGKNVWLVYTRDAYTQAMKHMGVENSSDCFTSAVTSVYENKDAKHVLFLIGLFEHTHSVFGHELIHICYRILDFVGVKVDTDNHEALAYLFTFLHTEFDKKLKKKGVILK